MAKAKAKKPTKEIKTELIFNKADKKMVTFGVKNVEGFMGPGAIQLSRDVFPADFEPLNYEVSAELLIAVTLKKK